MEATTVNEVSVSSDGSDKRDLDISGRGQPEPKRSRKVYTYDLPDKSVFVDTSMLAQSSPAYDDREEVSSQTQKDERVEAAEQSLIISEVSKKLEQYAKRAAYGGSGPRSKRGGSGVVTPPYGSAQLFSSTITYDDEYLAQPEEDAKNDPWLITESDSVSANESEGLTSVVTPDKAKAVVSVENLETAKSIVSRVLQNQSRDKRVELEGTTAILGFCVATAPVNDNDLSGQILQLLAQCEQLASDFQTYRAALRPDMMPIRGALKQTWERESSRFEAIRDFKMFAVNILSKFLNASEMVVSTDDRTILERTAETWVNSL